MNRRGCFGFLRGWAVAAAVLLFVASAAGRAFAASEQIKLAVEKGLEDRVQAALEKFVDPNQFLVIVKAETLSVDQQLAGAKPAEQTAIRMGYILPGIPERAKLDKEGKTESQSGEYEAFWQLRPFVKRLSVTLFIDERISSGVAQRLEVLAKQLMDFSTDRGDEFKVQKMPFRAPAAPEAEQKALTKGEHLRVSIDKLRARHDFLWIVMAGGVVVGLLLFLFGPLLFFLRKFPKVLQDAFPPMAGAAGAVSSGAGGGKGGGSQSTKGEMTLNLDKPMSMFMSNEDAGKAEVFLGEREKRPYSFINDQDVVNILMLMKDEPPLHLAILCYFLRPDLASGLISKLDHQVRRQVVESLAAPQLLMRDDVKSLGVTLKAKARGILYGVDQFFSIYDNAAASAQEDMIKTLETQNPLLAEKVRNEMFSFEDLMGLDTQMLRTVFRELPLRTLAISLMGSAIPFRDRILGILPPGAAEIIRQEIEMNPVKSQKTIDDERRRILQVVRRMVWEKKIVMPARRRTPAAGKGA